MSNILCGAMMILQKTIKAKRALEARSRELGVEERRVVILADGKREVSDIAAMLGDGVHEQIARLIKQGYLGPKESVEPVTDVAVQSRPKASLLRPEGVVSRLAAVFESAATSKGQAQPQPQPQPLGGDVVPTPSDVEPKAFDLYACTPRRRSLAAAKMYIVDMLQLQRSPEASALSVAIHTSESETGLIADILQALRFIEQRSDHEYAQKVRDQLLSTIPEIHVNTLMTAFGKTSAGAVQAAMNGTGLKLAVGR